MIEDKRIKLVKIFWLISFGTDEWTRDILICGENEDEVYAYIVANVDDNDIGNFFETMLQPTDDCSNSLKEVRNKLHRLVLASCSQDGQTYDVSDEMDRTSFVDYLKKHLSQQPSSILFDNLPIELYDHNGRPFFFCITNIQKIHNWKD